MQGGELTDGDAAKDVGFERGSGVGFRDGRLPIHWCKREHVVDERGVVSRSTLYRHFRLASVAQQASTVTAPAVTATDAQSA